MSKIPARRQGASRHAARGGPDADRVAFTLHPLPPFDFDLSASIFSPGDPSIRSYSGGTFRQAIRIDGGLALVTVTSGGTVDRPELRVRVDPGPASPGEREAAGRTITSLFNLGLDLSLFVEAVKDDPVMSALSRRLRGLKPPRTPTVFEALTDSIIEQQISLAAAQSMERRVVRTFGDTLEIGGETYYAFPTPARLAGAAPEELRACGLSGKKAEYIIGIASRIRDGDLDLENHGPGEDTEAVIREFSTLRGVGVWTAELAALRGLSRLDAIPADDIGIRRSISWYYSKTSRIDTAEARQIAEGWGAWKGLAAYYLLVAERMGI
ncbi:MAG TPA: DNA-3-methyladenine glycosylase, partial [Methanomicrobiales archaeon]|nr:DNA-3-methyladenine glycosylase [Methanomicrobiales archaeon]